MAVLDPPLASEYTLIPLLKTSDVANTSVMRLSIPPASDLTFLAYIMDSSNNQLQMMNIEISLDPLIDYSILRPEISIRISG